LILGINEFASRSGELGLGPHWVLIDVPAFIQGPGIIATDYIDGRFTTVGENVDFVRDVLVVDASSMYVRTPLVPYWDRAANTPPPPPPPLVEALAGIAVRRSAPALARLAATPNCLLRHPLVPFCSLLLNPRHDVRFLVQLNLVVAHLASYLTGPLPVLYRGLQAGFPFSVLLLLHGKGQPV